MRQMYRTLRHTEKVARLICRHADLQRTAVGQAHIFAGKAHQAARHIQRVLPRLQHPGQPVDRSVRVAELRMDLCRAEIRL